MPFTKVISSSMMAALLHKSKIDFTATFAAFKATSFPGISRECKPTLSTHYKSKTEVEDEGTDTGLACLQCRSVHRIMEDFEANEASMHI